MRVKVLIERETAPDILVTVDSGVIMSAIMLADMHLDRDTPYPVDKLDVNAVMALLPMAVAKEQKRLDLQQKSINFVNSAEFGARFEETAARCCPKNIWCEDGSSEESWSEMVKNETLSAHGLPIIDKS